MIFSSRSYSKDSKMFIDEILMRQGFISPNVLLLNIKMVKNATKALYKS